MAKKPVAERPAPVAVKEQLASLNYDYAQALRAFRMLYRSMQDAEARVKELGGPVAESIAVYARIYTIHEKMSDVAKHTLALKDYFSKQFLPEAMGVAEIDTLTISEGHRATLTEKVFASIPADNREKAYAWLRANGAEDLIVETVNASTLSAYAKSLAEDNKELPDDIFTVLRTPAVSLTRAKGWNMEEMPNDQAREAA